jgi:hypothetical protein
MSFKFSRVPQKCNLQACKHGKATAAPRELDVDAMLAAQAHAVGHSGNQSGVYGCFSTFDETPPNSK